MKCGRKICDRFSVCPMLVVVIIRQPEYILSPTITTFREVNYTCAS